MGAECARVLLFGFEGHITVRAFLALLIGAVLLGGCAAKPTAGGRIADAAKPTISDGSKSMTSESSPSLSASEDYERAVADYNNCILEHTSNLSACEKQQVIMNRLGKVVSRSPLSQNYVTANTPQAPSSQLPARVPPTPQDR
jgi:hypothetical protein